MLSSIQRTAGNRAASALVTRPLQRETGGGQTEPKGTGPQSLDSLAPEVRSYATSVQDYYAHMARIWEDSAPGGGPKYTGPFGRANLGTSADKEFKETLGEIFGDGNFDFRVSRGSGVEVDIFGSKFPIDIELKLTTKAGRSSQTIGLLKAAEENKRLLIIVYSNSPPQVYNFLPRNGISRAHLSALQDATSRIQGKLVESMGSAGRRVAEATAADDAAVGAKVPGGVDAAVPAAKVVVRNESKVLRILAEAGEVGVKLLKVAKFAGEIAILYDADKRGKIALDYAVRGEYGKALDQLPLFLWDQLEPFVDLLPTMAPPKKPNITFPIELDPDNPYPTGAQWGDPTVQ